MNLDNDAIRKAYPDAVTIDDTHGAFKLDGTKIDLVQSVIDAARVELNKLNYQRDRAIAYPSIQEQLDMQYWDQINGTTTWKDSIAKVKSDNPKP